MREGQAKSTSELYTGEFKSVYTNSLFSLYKAFRYIFRLSNKNNKKGIHSVHHSQ